MATQTVETNAQVPLGAIVIDDPQLVKLATDLDRMEADAKQRSSRISEARERLLESVRGKTEDDEAVFQIGPIQIKAKWTETEDKDVEFTRHAKKGYQYRFRLPAVQALKKGKPATARRTRAAASEAEPATASENGSAPPPRQRRTRAQVVNESTEQAQADQQAEEAAQAERNERIVDSEREPVGAAAE